MNKNDFLAALRQALNGLPPEERDSAMQYYEDYFADAGPENEQRALDDLGTPEAVAQAILSEYRDLATVPQPQGDAGPQWHKSARTGTPRVNKGISPWLLLVIVVLAIPLGVPLLCTGLALIVSFFAVVLSIGLVVVLVPFICTVVGVAVCWAGFLSLFTSPASGLYAIGGGLISIAIGLLIGMLFFKILTLFVPPLVRGFVNLCRRPFERRNPR